MLPLLNLGRFSNRCFQLFSALNNTVSISESSALRITLTLLGLISSLLSSSSHTFCTVIFTRQLWLFVIIKSFSLPFIVIGLIQSFKSKKYEKEILYTIDITALRSNL